MSKISKNERAWVEINLENIKKNYFEIKKFAKKNICAIIKADAYGHGDFYVAEALAKIGVKYFGVATVEEALNLKNLDAKILILGFTPENKLNLVVKNSVEQAVYDFATAEKLNNIAQKFGVKAKIHIKIDTGMHRLGFDTSRETVEKIKLMSGFSNLKIVGIFSHFAQSDIKNDWFTLEQCKKFKLITNELNDLNLIKHVSNSAGIINYQEFGFDMVRIGLMLYGLLPIKSSKINLTPVLELKSQLVAIKDIKAGESVSYNRKFIAQEKTKVGIVSIGYGDGYMRNNSNKAKVIINGNFAHVVGNICMDYMMINLNNIKAKVGDEIILIGKSGDLSITADDLAKINNTISYEIITSIGKRVPRYYI